VTAIVAASAGSSANFGHMLPSATAIFSRRFWRSVPVRITSPAAFASSSVVAEVRTAGASLDTSFASARLTFFFQRLPRIALYGGRPVPVRVFALRCFVTRDWTASFTGPARVRGFPSCSS
jgi:hypothetical protein